MPVGATVAAVGSVAGAAISSNATKKAANASQTATDQSLTLQREAMQLAQQNTETARAAGNLATNALTSRLGLGTPATSTNALAGYGGSTAATPTPTASSPAAQQQPNTTVTDPTKTFNAATYLAANPDVAAAVNDPNSQFAGATAAERAADHYARYGQAEVASGGRSLGSERPQMPGGQPTYTPQTYVAPTYTRPEYGNALDVSLDSYKSSPEYQAAMLDITRQGGQVRAAMASQGMLNSGAALKRLQEVGQENTIKYYGDFRDYRTGQYNTDRSRFDNNYNYDTGLNSQNALSYAGLNSQNALAGANYNQSAYQYGQNRADNAFNLDRAYGTDLALTNRNYEASRYDTGTNALFSLASLGQGAAANYTSASQNATNNSTNALFSNAANQGNASLTSANNINSLIGQGVNALAFYGSGQGGKNSLLTPTNPVAANYAKPWSTL